MLMIPRKVVCFSYQRCIFLSLSCARVIVIKSILNCDLDSHMPAFIIACAVPDKGTIPEELISTNMVNGMMTCVVVCYTDTPIVLKFLWNLQNFITAKKRNKSVKKVSEWLGNWTVPISKPYLTLHNWGGSCFPRSILYYIIIILIIGYVAATLQ